MELRNAARLSAIMVALICPAANTAVNWQVAEIKFPWQQHYAFGVFELSVMLGFGFLVGRFAVREEVPWKLYLKLGGMILVGTVGLVSARHWLMLQLFGKELPGGSMPAMFGLPMGAIMGAIYTDLNSSTRSPVTEPDHTNVD